MKNKYHTQPDIGLAKSTHNPMKIPFKFGAPILALALATTSANAATYFIDADNDLVPNGIGSGQSFQLVFVTSTSTTREDTPGSGTDNHSITHWNDYVNNVADGSSLTTVPAITWYAAASTISTAANVNAAVTHDVYRLDGVLVDTAASFWSDTGTNTDDGGIQNPINIDESGNLNSGVETWGGGPKYTQDGSIGQALGNGTNENSQGVTIGRSDRSGDGFQRSWWSDADGGFRRTPDESAHFYAISETITVVPEPSTALLGGLGMLLLLRRRR